MLAVLVGTNAYAEDGMREARMPEYEKGEHDYNMPKDNRMMLRDDARERSEMGEGKMLKFGKMMKKEKDHEDNGVRAYQYNTKWQKTLLERLSAAVERMNGLTTRASSRLEKVKATGADTTSASVALTEAQASLTKAKTAFEDLKKAIEAIPTTLNDDSSSDDLEKELGVKMEDDDHEDVLKPLAKNVEVALKATNKSLVKVVMELKKAAKTTATTPVTNTEVKQ